jgi:hypothetical protein
MEKTKGLIGLKAGYFEKPGTNVDTDIIIDRA